MDRDDILYSKSFRRLAYKRQLFSDPDTQSFYSRLTHTLIVAQIARSIARGLRLNELLAEAIALGHDLGHPPYGHSGEDGINHFLTESLFPRLAETEGFGKIKGWTIEKLVAEEHRLAQTMPGPLFTHRRRTIPVSAPPNIEELKHWFHCLPSEKGVFKHNRQSYRIAMFLEKDGNGLDLCLETYYGILRASGKARDDDDFRLNEVTTDYSSFEAQVVRLADDIAWPNHDLTEDSQKTGRSIQQLLDDFRFSAGKRQLPVHHRDLFHFLEKGPGERYGVFISDAIKTNQNKLSQQGFQATGDRPGYRIKLSGKSNSYLKSMREIVIRAVHHSKPVGGIDKESSEETRKICELLADPNNFRESINHPSYRPKLMGELSDLARLRIVADVVALMTDAEAHEFREQYTGSFASPKDIEPIEWPLKS